MTDHKPKRIQRKRSKGWRMPEGAVYVGRPTVWGNRYRVGPTGVPGNCADAEIAVAMYRRMWSEPHQLFYIRQQLHGKDLACWCALDSPCHADVLLELANA